MNANDQSGFFPSPGVNRRDKYANPFYGVPHTYIPRNMEDMLWWSNHFLLRFSFYRTALFRVANYFITDITIECDDSAAKDRYKEIFEDLKWKEVLAMAGLNLLAYGNVFMSINQGFDRFMICPDCGKHSNIEKIQDYEFTKEAQYVYKCPQCRSKHTHEVKDQPSKDLHRVTVTFWDPRQVIVRYEDTTSESEYYWDIPQEYKAKVLKKNNKFYSKKTPKAIYDCLLQDKPLAFNLKNFVHLKVPSPVGIPTDGKSIPFCIYLFDEFFMLKVIERYNQAICFEDIIPFRVFSMAENGNVQANSVLHQSGSQWNSAVTQMIEEHRLDPGGYFKVPFPINYQQIGGDAKNLVTPELMQMHMSNLLNALNIPQELYTMQLQAQAVGPALRLFENSWSFLISVYNDLLDHWGDVCGKIAGLPKAKISIKKVTLSDDMERKSVIGQLVSANAIARSELLELYNFEYKDQVRKKLEEDAVTKELQQEQQVKDQLKEMAESGQFGSQGGPSPQDVLSQAQEIAQQLFPLDGAQRRAKLQEIKSQDATLYSAVKQALEELTAGHKSNGLSEKKQQAAQGQQGAQ